jgi:serine/threonine protein kinase
MGSVWLAQHLALGINCAMKFVDGQARAHPELVARFELEAKVEAQLRSPHVVHVLDHGLWQGIPYMAMEYLEGETLADRIYKLGRIEPSVTYRVVAHVARALMHAHAIGIVHRDLKPENIFIVPSDDGEIVKVLDFGVAKFTTGWTVSRVTKTGLLVGTPLYMSPEQARGTREIDGRADLWSLAVIAYQCLTGSLPFMSEGLGDLLAKIMFDPIPRPTEVVSDLPPEIDGWWLLASSRDLDSRFQSAKELADALGAALGQNSVIPISDIAAGTRADRLSLAEISISTPPPPDDLSLPRYSLLPSWVPSSLVDFFWAHRLLAAAFVGGVLVTLAVILARSGRSTPPIERLTVTAPAAPPPRDNSSDQEPKEVRVVPEAPSRSGIRTDDLPAARASGADAGVRRPNVMPRGGPPRGREGQSGSKVDFGI